MAKKGKKSMLGSGSPTEMTELEKNIMAARKTLLDMKEKLLAEGLGKSLPESLVRPFDTGDEGDQADTERTREVSVLLSEREKEKLLAIEEALERIREGTYGECDECGDEIGTGRLKAMSLANLCVPCQSRLEKEQAHQNIYKVDRGQSLISDGGGEETD